MTFREHPEYPRDRNFHRIEDGDKVIEGVRDAAQWFLEEGEHFDDMALLVLPTGEMMVGVVIGGKPYRHIVGAETTRALSAYLRDSLRKKGEG